MNHSLDTRTRCYRCGKTDEVLLPIQIRKLGQPDAFHNEVVLACQECLNIISGGYRLAGDAMVDPAVSPIRRAGGS